MKRNIMMLLMWHSIKKPIYADPDLNTQVGSMYSACIDIGEGSLFCNAMSSPIVEDYGRVADSGVISFLNATDDNGVIGTREFVLTGGKNWNAGAIGKVTSTVNKNITVHKVCTQNPII